MPFLFDLPPGELPKTWDEAMHWARSRDGYRSDLRVAIDAMGIKQVAAELIQVSKDGKMRSAKTWIKDIEAFLDGDEDLWFREVALIARIVGCQPRVREIPPFDVFRESWTRSEPPHPRDLSPYGFRIWRMQPTTFDRAINAAMRRWSDPAVAQDEEEGQEPELYVSRGAGFMAVLEGEVEMTYLAEGGVGTKRISAGEGLFYRMSWPHSFRAVPQDGSSATTTIDLCASKRGIPPEYDMKPYHAPNLVANFPSLGDEPAGEDSVRHTLSHALACCDRKSLVKLLDLRKGSGGAKKRQPKAIRDTLAAIEKGVSGPSSRKPNIDFSYILEIAHILRIPESHFFTPLREHLDTAFSRNKLQLLGDIPGDPKGIRTRSLGHPPTEIVDRKSQMEVRLLDCPPEATEQNAPMVRESDEPGERMLIVLSGKLGVRLYGGLGGAGAVKWGVLERGDSLWLRADHLAHGLWNADPKAGTVRALDVRYPYAAGRPLAWGMPR